MEMECCGSGAPSVERCHHHCMTGRALSFGSVASAYEQFRPGYPDELVREVLTYAGGPVRTALEIGAGTGKATRVFARHGVAVTATDPDAAMLTELRKHVPASVATVRGAFEDLPLGPSSWWTTMSHRLTRRQRTARCSGPGPS